MRTEASRAFYDHYFRCIDRGEGCGAGRRCETGRLLNRAYIIDNESRHIASIKSKSGRIRALERLPDDIREEVKTKVIEIWESGK